LLTRGKTAIRLSTDWAIQQIVIC